MSEVIDNETGKPVTNVATVAAGAVAAGSLGTLLVTSEAAREAVITAGTTVLKTMAKNPKLTVALAGLGLVAYGVRRVTKKGTELTVGAFKYVRK